MRRSDLDGTAGVVSGKGRRLRAVLAPVGRGLLLWRWRPSRLPRYSPSRGAGWGSVPPPHPSRRYRLTGPLLSALLSAALVALGVVVLLIAFTGRPTDGQNRHAQVQPRPRVSDTALHLRRLQGWHAPKDAPGIPGLPFQAPIALQQSFSGLRLIAGLLPATSTTLLPATLVRRLQPPPARPQTVRLDDGLHAYYYPGLTVAGVTGQLDVYVVPTTAGVATLACIGTRDLTPPYYDCWSLVRTLTLRAARPLKLGPDAAFRQRLPDALATLDAARGRARPGLASRIPAAQAAAVQQLGVAFETVATSLAPLVPGSPTWPGSTDRELASIGRAYRDLAAPLLSADAVAFARGTRIVHARERRLQELLVGAEP